MSPGGTAKTENLTADVVVIGGGGAGLAAAVAAAEKGDCSVVVLEKREDVGGNTARAANFFGVESPAQKRAGIDVRTEDFFKAFMNWHHWSPNPRITRAFIDKSGDTIRWLEEKGLHFGCFPLYADQTMVVYHLTEGAGAAIIRVLAEECQKLGIHVLTNTPAKQLLVGENGNVTGILAETNGKEFTITTKSVIIAAGGYGGNKELVKKYYPDYRGNMQSHGVLNSGDGLLMAMEIGAATVGMEIIPRGGGGGFPAPLPQITLKLGSSGNTFELPLVCVCSDSSVVWINNKGQRFCDEAYLGTHHPVCEGITKQQLHKTSYTLFDQGIVQSFTEEGLSVGYLHIAPRGTKLPGFESELRVKANEGWVKISDSLDEISKWIEADPKVLKATIDEYNAACYQGYDPTFAKDKRYLVPLRTPPYYVVRARLDEDRGNQVSDALDARGGIKVNEHMEVLNKDDAPIPGLYAAGTTTGGWEPIWDDSMHSGNGASFAFNTGRIAAENAASFIKGKLSKYSQGQEQ